MLPAGVPYTTDEKRWLKLHYRGEFHFLRIHGLSIYSEEDRREGRAIARALMRDESGADLGSGATRGDELRRGIHDENTGNSVANANDSAKDAGHGRYDDYGSDGDDGGDADESESEDDEYAYVGAMAGFSLEEEAFVKRHWGSAHNFLICHGLKFYKPEDCTEALLILRALRAGDD